MADARLALAGCAFDVAILGGGLAGLSLAVRLAAPRFAGLRVLVVERRAAYVRDRTWSYWSGTPHPFQAAVTHTWDRWSVEAANSSAMAEATGLRYETVRSDALYRLALDTIAAAPHIELRLGTCADVTETSDGILIGLPGGTVRAGVAFDTRPPPDIGRNGLTQVFLGQEVETERPIFDSGTAILMDFRVEQAGASHFTYVLPTSPTHALVEDTWFAPAGFRPPDHRAAIADYLAAQNAGAFTVQFEEAGALPMDPVYRPVATERLIPLGTAGGATRPSTGYAFTAIQAQCDAIMAEIELGRVPRLAPLRPALTRFMDHVLLDLLEQRPALAPRVFTALFAGCPPRRLVRFLSDQATPADFVAVAAAIPLWPTLSAAARMAMGQMAWPRPATAG